MATATDARQYLEAIASQALWYYEVEGNTNKAVLAFLNDVRKHDGTRHIYSFPGVRKLLFAAAAEGSEKFKEVMLGFDVD